MRRTRRSAGLAAGRRHQRLLMGFVLALLTSLMALVSGPGAAQAATPEYEITGSWVNPPPTIARGNPVVAEWRINVNDAEEPPSNEPVDNVTAEFVVDKAFFDEMPDMCLTDDVEPPSTISDDGRTLVCNFGTVRMGTAIIMQTPVVADGMTGEEVTMRGTGPGGQNVSLPPIEIRNPFAMDIYFGQNTNFQQWNDEFTASTIDVQWTLRLGRGSDPGPNEVTYRLDVGDSNLRNVNVGVSPGGDTGCSRFNLGVADGHPWSRDDLPPEHPRANSVASFVEQCILTEDPNNPGVFFLTLRGINYDLQDVPTHDSVGNPLPQNWNAVASGSLWFRVLTDESGSITVDANEPLITAPTGQTYRDLAGNNVTSKTYTLPGSWAAAWRRPYTGSGGTVWDDTYRVSAGTTVQQVANNRMSADGAPASSLYGNCLVFDYEYVTFNPDQPVQLWAVDPGESSTLVEDIPFEYYVGDSVGNPDDFNCATDPGNWTTNPTDPTAVKAVRVTYPFSEFAARNAEYFSLWANTTINADVQPGQDVWMFGLAMRQGEWLGVGEPWDSRPVTNTPDARYPFTNGRRDILRVITAVPFIEKSTPRSTVTPGVPADFTLTYSANGSGLIPPTVDDYVIQDVLPQGMTYEPGSATPPPTRTFLDGQGRQVLEWTLDGVETNVDHEITYQAVVNSSVPPGTQLTNTATASFGGTTTDPAEETVTTSTNGYTTILKTADVDFIPNQNGDGVGTGSWTVTIDSFDPLPQEFTDTIDILPYNGDERGTSYSGSYSLVDVIPLNGGTVYYTDADPTTLSDDPADTSNGAPGTTAGNTVGWTTMRPENPTAIRVIGGTLAPGASFAFRVVITTDGAQPQDVYVNRAQARAEHTELVMRTSAPLVVTDYVVEKFSDPESGTTVRPGDVVTYTVKVTQQGPVPAGAWFTDTLTDVFDDAVYNEDVQADRGIVSIQGDLLSWEGVLPVGEVATITYSVTVKDVPGLKADGNTRLHNDVESVGCVSEESCETEHPVGYFEYSKTSEAAPGETVQVGEVITYTVRIHQRGEGPVPDASVRDDLSAVLDDARWNDDVTASAGQAVRMGRRLVWTGDLGVGDVVTVRYSVTVKAAGEGDDRLLNVVTTDDNRGACIPAPDQNPDCTTSHELGDYEVVKTSNPPTGSQVDPGDSITYTVTVRHVGIAPVEEASLEDDLSAVLDDASWNGDLTATAGSARFDRPVLTWTGPLDVGASVTLTYSVTVQGDGDRHIQNVVTTPGECVPAPNQDEACTTEHGLAPVVAGLPATGAPRNVLWLVSLGIFLLIAGSLLTVVAVQQRKLTSAPI